MNYTKAQLSNFDFCKSLEWIETNGIGGYASGTVSGALTRTYHGLLVASLHPPVGRMAMISKLDETIVDGSDRYELSSNQYTGVVHPDGFKFLSGFTRDLFPEFYFEAAGFKIKKTIAAIDGENATIILYEIMEAPNDFVFELLPLYAYRDFHAVSHANESIRQSYTFQNGTFQTINYNDCPGIFITIPGSTFVQGRCWYYNFEYTEERNRGLEFIGDLYTHGRFNISLKKGSKVGVILSTEAPGEKDAFRLFQKEKGRREKIVQNYSGAESLKRLAFAADQFIVKRGELKTVIAGYHWFSDWGRDTMISLPGLCLVTGRFDDAKNILRAFANSVSEGMLPNRFPDYNELPEYNTIDATLWYFNAVYQYYTYANDLSFIQSIIPVLTDIIAWHESGTRYAIRVDPSDGLLSGGQDGVQLTWMDAKVGNWVVTPRRGKAVEINALWYNALRCLDFLLSASGQPSSDYKSKAAMALNSFTAKFWNDEKEYLYDVIQDDKKDDTLRPNAIYAVSLPFPIYSGEHAQKIMRTIEKEFLTSRGLRSLARSHPEYHPVYEGDQWHRDGAYHQGTVWSFLLGAYIDGLVMTFPDGRHKASQLLLGFLPHLDEAGAGTVSEIFDGEPPHAARGCIAQAWSVAEIFRVAIVYELLK